MKLRAHVERAILAVHQPGSEDGEHGATCPLFAFDAVDYAEAVRTLAPDDEQERRVTLLLLGKGGVLAHWLVRPLAAELDESEQRGDEPQHASPFYRIEKRQECGLGRRC